MKVAMQENATFDKDALYDLTIAANDLILEIDAEMNIVNKVIIQ